MKKRSFVLLELFIALALVALFSLPLVKGQFFYARKQKERLLNLEKERKAEELFYRICEGLTSNHKLLHDIPYRAHKNAIFALKENNKVNFDFGELKRQETFYWHYHLYSNVDPKKNCRKLHFKICFLENPKDDCETVKKFADAKYGFTLTVQQSPK